MAYADFSYYRDTFLGTAIEETAFPRYALRASSYLDYFTQGKAAKNPEMDALKMACCALAEQYQTIESAASASSKSLSAAASSGEAGELQSQSVGGWSKTYRSGGDSAAAFGAAQDAAERKLSSIARTYLAGTGLLYRGVCFRG